MQLEFIAHDDLPLGYRADFVENADKTHKIPLNLVRVPTDRLSRSSPAPTTAVCWPGWPSYWAPPCRPSTRCPGRAGRPGSCSPGCRRGPAPAPPSGSTACPASCSSCALPPQGPGGPLALDAAGLGRRPSRPAGAAQPAGGALRPPLPLPLPLLMGDSLRHLFTLLFEDCSR